MENVVVSVFSVESEAFQAFAEIRQAPWNVGFSVIEAALVKRENGRVVLLEGYDLDEKAGSDTALGAVIGGLIGLLGGPFGLILGVVAGGAIGSVAGEDDVVDSLSGIEVVADKLNDGDIAVMALVRESGTGFDAAFQKYDVSTTRYGASEIVAEVESAREIEKELSKEARKKLRADRKAERAARHEGGGETE